jgi:SAM-dependent methyltransferase
MISGLNILQRVASTCIQHICWMIDVISLQDGILSISGWVILFKGNINKAAFSVNGTAFERVAYPLDSPDLANRFYQVGQAGKARFRCEISVDLIPEGNYYCLEYTQDGDRQLAQSSSLWYRTYYLGNPQEDVECIGRVIGSNSVFSFELDGATLFKRFENYLQKNFSLDFQIAGPVLDCGCGAGRLLRHFSSAQKVEVWGSDIDHDNLDACNKDYPSTQLALLPLQPPTQLPQGYFGLVIGISVMTHLSKANQELWFAELRRIVWPRGLVLLSVQGDAQSALYREAADLLRRRDTEGFVVKGINPAINNIIGEQTYYLDVIQSRHDTVERWTSDFEVVEFIGGFAANQDLVVMRTN